MGKTLLTTGLLLAGLLAPPAFAIPNPECEFMVDNPAQKASVEPSMYLIGQDITKLQQLARSENILLTIIVPNPASLKYSFQPGFVAKTSDLKACKSTPDGENAGLVQCSPALFSNYQEWLEEKAMLRQMGYSVLGERQDYLVVRFDGKKLFSDYDLLGVYSLKTGAKAFTEELRLKMNTVLGRRMVRHGPLLDYERRHMIGLKFPVVTITPDGVHVSHDKPEIIALYEKYGITWDWP